ncbi:MAG: nucleotide exchange factor GrpE [Flammeovirgaceae bacterium]
MAEETTQSEPTTEEVKNETSTQNDNMAAELKKLQDELAEQKDKYLRLLADFENARRRQAKERLELLKTAAEDLMKAVLPIIDDFERAQKHLESDNATLEVAKEGVTLIHNKLLKTLQSKGLKEMSDVKGSPFNPDLHEAISQVPAPSEDLKGKVIDVLDKGYYLEDKVIRFAKVITGA